MITYSVKFRELIPRDNNDVRHGLVTCRHQKEKSTLIGDPPSYKELKNRPRQMCCLWLGQLGNHDHTYDNKLN